MPSGRSLSLAVLALACGCALKLKKPEGPAVTRPVLSPDESWQRVLLQRVDKEGRFDYAGLRSDPNNLHNFISYLATYSPETDPQRFPSAASRTAYYLNAYNALAVYAVLDSGQKPVDRKRFYGRTKMIVGGELRTLDDLQEELRELKDPRVYFAMNGAARGFGRLIEAPYAAATMEAQLAGAAERFFNDPRNVQVESKRRVVRLSELMKWRRSELLDRAPSLLAYVNRFRAEKVPEDYKVEFLPFDWQLNDQAAPEVKTLTAPPLSPSEKPAAAAAKPQ